MKAVIHAGMHKTGTTSFQKACRDGENKLKDAGIFYPDLRTIDKESGFPLCHSDIPMALLNRKEAKAQEYIELSIAKAVEADCEKVLFSSESFCTLNWRPENLAKLTQFLDKGFDSFEYVLVLRDVRAIFKSYLKQFIVHFGCDLSGDLANLREKLGSILHTGEKLHKSDIAPDQDREI